MPNNSAEFSLGLMRALFLAWLLVLSAAASCRAAQPVKFDKSQLVGGDFPRGYRPPYPVEARRRGETGSGVYILHVNSKTGEVTSVTIQQSTRHEILDNAVVATCAHWRFKPHTVTEVRLPITFSIGGR